MMMADRLLAFYFQKVLKAASMLPPPLAYKILPATGHLFRKWDVYSAGVDEPGILFRAEHNLKHIGLFSDRNIKQIINNNLRFESRVVTEKYWIRERNKSKILNSFNASDLTLFQNLLEKNTCVIVSAHVAGIFMLLALPDLIHHNTLVIRGNPLTHSWKHLNPFIMHSIETVKIWKEYQPFIFMDEGDMMNKSRAALSSGTNVLICPDLPGFSQGVQVNFFNQQVVVPVGAVKLARDADVPILITIPWTFTCTEPHRLYLKIIHPEDINEGMTTIMESIESVIKLNPACWAGWMYIDRMLAA
jgi:lauroyl/myristoyl acyltransferase